MFGKVLAELPLRVWCTGMVFAVVTTEIAALAATGLLRAEDLADISATYGFDVFDRDKLTNSPLSILLGKDN